MRRKAYREPKKYSKKFQDRHMLVIPKKLKRTPGVHIASGMSEKPRQSTKSILITYRKTNLSIRGTG